MMGGKNINITIQIHLQYPMSLSYIEFCLNGETIEATSELITFKLKKGDTLEFLGGARTWRCNVIVDGVHVGITRCPGWDSGEPPLYYTFHKSSLVELTYFDAY